MNEIEKTPLPLDSAFRAIAESTLIFLLFFIFAGWPAPDVNEAHYLAKAKNYWNPQWCQGDLFLESGQAHLFFYWTFGWLTLLLPLPAVAWIGRLVTWAALAWAWRRLSYLLVPRPWMSVLSASLFLFFHSGFHMAGEWVVGGVEAKGLAYVFVFLALGDLVQHRWRRVWILLGIATSLHVLVGGWSWVAAMVAWLACGRSRPPLIRRLPQTATTGSLTPATAGAVACEADAACFDGRPMLPAMIVGILLALPGLIAGLMLSHGVDAQTVRNANIIYVYHRLGHHLVFHRFPTWFILRHGMLLLAWVGICLLTPCMSWKTKEQRGNRAGVDLRNWKQRPFRGFVGGAVLIALIGILIDQSLLYRLDLAASLLKYYWYRLTDVFLPVGVALGIATLVHHWWHARPQAARWILAASMLVSGGYLVWWNVDRRSDMRPAADIQMLPSWPDDPERTQQKYESWKQVCRWIRDHTPPDAVFVTPRHQQTFKWYAERAEVFSWKDVPQDPASVIQWWQRLRWLYPHRVVRWGFAALGEARLVDLARHYGATHIVVDRDISVRELMLPRIYPPIDTDNPSYVVYRVPPAPESDPESDLESVP